MPRFGLKIHGGCRVALVVHAKRGQMHRVRRDIQMPIVGIVSVLATAGMALAASTLAPAAASAGPVGGRSGISHEFATGAPSAASGINAWKVSQKFQRSQIRSFAGISCPSATTCYAAGIDGTFVTTNSGTTWTALTLQPSGGGSYSIACPSTMTCYTSDGRTMDGGKTWSAYSTEASPSGSIACPSTTTCYRVGSYGILVTTDSGTSWQLGAMASGTEGYQYAIACPSVTTCFAVGYDSSYNAEILGTIDSGATWKVQTRPPGVLDLPAIACPSVTTCFVLGSLYVPPGTETEIIAATTDSGATWRDRALNGVYSGGGISCPSTTTCSAIPASGRGPILRTVDGWTSWNNETFPSGTNLLTGVACPSTTICYAVGMAGKPLSGGLILKRKG